MRQIKANAPPRASRFPQNVEEAIQQAAAAQDAGEEVAEEIRVPVGAVDAVIKPGPDKKFGTPDDDVRIEGHKDDDEHEHAEPEVEEPEEPKAKEPKVKYSKDMTKRELQALADEHGVLIRGLATKAKIVAALDKHFGE